jgi:uncharacterized membrane protein YoaK (UPF0700 family)
VTAATKARSHAHLARRRHLLAVLLTVNSGVTDAVGFLALGGAFTSVMTGNLVLLGLASSRADSQLVTYTGTAIACYIFGCVLGARVAGSSDRAQHHWPTPVTRALTVEFALFCAYAVVWWSTGSDPAGLVRLSMLAISAIALGVQSSAVQRFGVSGLSTTYMTGTLTSAIINLTTGKGLRAAQGGLQLLAGLIAGAVIGGVVLRYVPVLVPALQLSLLVTVVLAGLRLSRTEPEPEDLSAAT